ncbi:MAG: glycosyltransferase, partial [Opitutales bacterium]
GGFAERGHSVEVMTETPATPDHRDPFPVIRSPGPLEVWKAVGRADVVWQNNISLKYLWACLLRGKPTAVTLATALYRHYPRKGLRERLKARLLRRCRVVAISRYVVNDTDLPYELLGNPYEGRIRERARGVEKDRDLVFVGRLVSDKGADLLLEALASLRESGLRPSCTVIGDGPERSSLEAQAASLGLETQLSFTGYLKDAALHREIARHRIMVVPSRWKEPFGVVALEGIAAGCAVVGSSGGGLVDAIGPCGTTFDNDDAKALAGRLRELLEDPERVRRCVEGADEHLARFSVDAQCERYLRIFDEMLHPPFANDDR